MPTHKNLAPAHIQSYQNKNARCSFDQIFSLDPPQTLNFEQNLNFRTHSFITMSLTLPTLVTGKDVVWEYVLLAVMKRPA